jgi:hypothetical protein
LIDYFVHDQRSLHEALKAKGKKEQGNKGWHPQKGSGAAGIIVALFCGSVRGYIALPEHTDSYQATLTLWDDGIRLFFDP